MGNQLMGIAPSQIFPVEHYLTDHPELKFDTSLGSTRFLKVVRADTQEGLIVVKVFAIHDPSLPLLPYKDHLDEIRNKLSSACNCLPFQKVIVTEKAGLIMREYVKSSLYDRISTRPFLTNIEKRWITFQVLYALYQSHKVGVCHGDIKLENITVTSWNWVLLVDFAAFKPTFLPEDNPADYSYFFDTSRRRVCYIAPERFIKTLSMDSNTMFNENPCNSGDLKPAMDIFSAGCALLELWNEGHAPFDLSQLLAYRSGEYSPQRHLDRLEDTALKNLLSSMIQRDPSQRLSAEIYLSQERGNLFPEYFYIFLQSYMLIFSASPIISSDEKIARLKCDIGNIFKLFCSNGDSEDANPEEMEDNDGLVIIVSLVTSNIRGLHDCTSKLQSLEILYELAKHANEETILDRILPYIMFLVNDQNARVKVAAINTITKCLNVVKKVPRSDANIFPDYILPGLAPLAIDPSTCVRAAYAKNIADFAEISLRFLDYSQADNSDKGVSKHSSSRLHYEVELQSLHEMVQKTVSALLTDSQAIVKQTLLHSGISKLCVFFGRVKANDILLSHIITFLNDKEDKELRGTFFDCIVGIAAYIGWHCSIILTPLLLQGLTDSSEFVTVKAISAMSALTELGLITKPTLVELVTESACFLVHPNLWIRQALAGFICTVAKVLSLLDLNCKIMPIINPFMKYSIMQIEKPDILLDALINPIPRNVYDNVIKYSDIALLLETLKGRKEARGMVLTTIIPTGDFLREVPQTIKSLITRLEANGMNETIEDCLLSMESHLTKINKHRQYADAKNKSTDGKIEIKSGASTVKSHVYNLSQARNAVQPCDISRRQSESTNSGEPSSRTTTSRPSSPTTESSTHSSRFTNEQIPNINLPMANMSIHERSYIQYRKANCSRELRTLISRQQDHYLEALRSKERAEQAAWQPQLPPPGWRLGGTLVAHLHEHRSAVTKLVPNISEKSIFASASLDGSIKLWDCSKMEGKNIANRSKINYKIPSGSGIHGLTLCDHGHSLAAASQDGNITVLRVENARLNPFQTRQMDNSEGCALDLQYLDSSPQSLLVYATLYGSLVGWDLRSPTNAWKLENGLKCGVISSFCIDSHQSWLTLGTSSGTHIAWDLRFQLPITTIAHPTTSRIRKVVSHPTEHSCILSSVQGNNEISMWNLETQNREKVLWASSSPPLSKTQVTNQSVYAMQAGCIDRSGYLLAGGTDQRLRFWDLENPHESYIAITSPNDCLVSNSVSYQNRLIDGTSLIQEIMSSSANPTGSSKQSDEIPRAGPEQPHAGHRDAISDIALCKTSQCLLLTASRDGVIKVWK